MPDNASFLCFKPSGKYYTEGRGVLPESAFSVWSAEERKEEILKANDGKWPGLSGKGEGYFCVAIGDESNTYGWPLHFKPTREL